MPRCPRCSHPLRILRDEQGQRWLCSTCGGEALSLSRARRSAGEPLAADLRRSIAHAQPSSLRCPGCRGRLHAFRAHGLSGPELDACRRCALVWFDRDEWQDACTNAGVPRTPEQLREARQQAEGLLALQTARVVSDHAPVLPIELRQWIPALLGTPWEIEDAAPWSPPWLTWGLMLLLATVGLAAAIDAELFEELQLTRAALGEGHPLALLGYALAHEHLILLLLSLTWCFVFGDDVENVLGRARFVAFVLGATLAGALAFLAGPWSREAVLCGAGPLVGGLVVFYALRFPHARLAYYLLGRYGWTWSHSRPWSLRFRARTLLVLWVLLQLAYVLAEERAQAAANLGGGLAGCAAWLAFRERESDRA